MRILSFGQQVLLDAQMTVVNQLVVELKDGRKVAVPTSEETVQTLMKLHMGIDPDTVVNVGRPAPVGAGEEAVEDEEESVDPGEIYSGGLMGSLEEEAETVIEADVAPPAETVSSDGFVVRPQPRTVPKDAMGYPIVQPSVGKVKPRQRELLADEDGEQI